MYLVLVLWVPDTEIPLCHAIVLTALCENRKVDININFAGGSARSTSEIAEKLDVKKKNNDDKFVIILQNCNVQV